MAYSPKKKPSTTDEMSLAHCIREVGKGEVILSLKEKENSNLRTWRQAACLQHREVCWIIGEWRLAYQIPRGPPELQRNRPIVQPVGSLYIWRRSSIYGSTGAQRKLDVWRLTLKNLADEVRPRVHFSSVCRDPRTELSIAQVSRESCQRAAARLWGVCTMEIWSLRVLTDKRKCSGTAKTAVNDDL